MKEREEEDGSDEHDEEWLMHHEKATVYLRCIDDLTRALAAASASLTA